MFHSYEISIQKSTAKKRQIQTQENINPQNNKYKSEGAKQIQIPGVRMNH